MKKFICIFSALIILMSVFSISSFAAATEIIDKADIEMIVNTDGTVNVTEKWTVSYVNASDTFYRNIDIYSASNGMTLLQKYDEITDVAVRIDGKSVPPEGAGINTFTFGKASDGLSYEIAVSCPSAQITREYEISYTVTGAVKKSAGKAVFAFMVLGEKFAYTSNNVTVTVNFPGEVTDISTAVEYDAIVDDNWIVFTSKRVFDKFSVDASSDISAFDKSALASYSVLAENVRVFTDSLLNVLPLIIAVIGIILVILLVLMSDKLVRKSSENSAKKLLKAVGEGESLRQLPDSVTACQAYRMLVPVSKFKPAASSKKVTALFAMAVLECMEKGYIVADRNKLVVGTPKEDAPSYILSVLNFLKTFCDKKGNTFVLDKDFSDKVRTECATRYDVITNYLATFSGLIPETGLSFFRKETNKEIYENAYIVKANAVKIRHKPSFAMNAESVLSGGKTGDAEVFSMLFASSSPEKMFASGGNEGIQALCEAMAAMYGIFIKSK